MVYLKKNLNTILCENGLSAYNFKDILYLYEIGTY